MLDYGMASHSTWTEQDYRAAGYRRLSLRLPADVAVALDSLISSEKSRPVELISQLILRAYRKSTRVEKKPTAPT